MKIDFNISKFTNSLFQKYMNKNGHPELGLRATTTATNITTISINKIIIIYMETKITKWKQSKHNTNAVFVEQMKLIITFDW